MQLDTATPTGKLMLNMLGSIAQFERELMLERQREGIAKAKAEGKYRGRVPTARRKADEVLRLRQEGRKAVEIAEELGISRASVFRILADPAT
jgi:DNA invertase Pin-like site-specific DNA recombinase